MKMIYKISDEQLNCQKHIKYTSYRGTKNTQKIAFNLQFQKSNGEPAVIDHYVALLVNNGIVQLHIAMVR